MDTYVHDAYIELWGVQVWPPSTALHALVAAAAIALVIGIIISTITWRARNR